MRVELVATESVWVAAAADGLTRFQTTLRPQQMRVVTAQNRVRLHVGNAGGLNLTLNGQVQAPLGPKGQVRIVLLTPEGMRVLTPTPSALQ